MARYEAQLSKVYAFGRRISTGRLGSGLRVLSRRAFIVAIACTCAIGGAARPSYAQSGAEPIKIGSKSFTESVILGEMLCTLADHAGAPNLHRSELGGTQILWKSLISGEIDAYIEYSGTIKEEILQGEQVYDLQEIRQRLEREGVGVSEALGFNNTYALGMTESRAAELGIRTISDLRNHPDLQLGFSDEFVERGDGWYGLKSKYQLPQTAVRALDHSLAYQGVRAGSIDVIDLYSTDPEIVAFNLRVLQDDRAYFPLYQAVVLYRLELAETHPDVVKAFEQLVSKIDGIEMAKLNKQSRIDHKPERLIAAEFLHDKVDAAIAVPKLGGNQLTRAMGRFLVNAWEHCYLVLISLTLAIACALPLGIVAYRVPRLGEWILGVVGVIQTIPSMALMVFMIPILGLGARPAIVALFMYSLLPIVRGTHTGLSGLSSSIHESALALGLPSRARLTLIELPLATQSILSGTKTSAVIIGGTATIGALIGAGGFGQPILTGIRLADVNLILQGAVPAAGLALLAQWMFGQVERRLVPAGLVESSRSH